MVSTAWVYKNSKFVLTKTKKKDINKIFKKHIFNIKDILFNDLEKVTLKRHPFLKLIKASLVDSGASGALMSGSGASIFGIFYSLKRAHEASGVIGSFEGRDVFVVRGMA